MLVRHHELAVVAACAVLVSISFPLLLNASDPIYSITYDTPLTVSCEEVARSEKTKTVVATIPVSVRFQGNARALQEVNIEFESLSRTALVVDFLPKTTTVTDVLGPIRIQTTTETGGDAKVRFKAETTARADLGNVAGAEASNNSEVEASISYRELTSKSYEQLPPRQMLIASGIQKRSHGVFFKLKPNDQHPIEGQRNFICLFQVDLGWRGECISARFSPDSNKWGGRPDPVYIIGLHLHEDVDAKTVVERAAVPIAKFQSETFFDVKELESIRASYWFPWFGLGSDAAKLESRIADPRAKYDKAISEIRDMNSRD